MVQVLQYQLSMRKKQYHCPRMLLMRGKHRVALYIMLFSTRVIAGFSLMEISVPDQIQLMQLTRECTGHSLCSSVTP